MPTFEIRPLEPSPRVLERLRDILIAVVAGGGSVTFMHPLEREGASAFWQTAFAAVARGERVILGAFEGGILGATVTLHLDCPPNQPHRAEIAKLMTHPDHRGRGAAAALMRAAERTARERGRTLLVLDTASDGGASRLYEGLGYELAGHIPGFALKPHGGLTGTNIYFKRVAA